MNALNRIPPAVAALVILVFLAGFFPASPAAQERPGPTLEVAGGALVFPDDATVTEGFGGGAVRFYVTPRISIGPEFAFTGGDRRSHQMLTGNVTVDLLGASSRQSRPFTPFVVAGGGLFRTREEFPHEIFTSSEGAFTAGGGLRVRAGDRVSVGGEVRLGWELHVRANALAAVRLGR